MARPAAHASPFHALADPTRREVLELLRAKGPLDAGTILETLRDQGVKAGQSTLSQHLAVLRKCGMVSTKWVGQRHVYSYAPAAMKPVIRWVEPFRRG
ncbi:MAG: ArsR/SmtB family transcription factor [Phycisphaerales bacterium]